MDTSVRRPTTTRLSKAIVTTILCLLISATATSDVKELCHPQDKKALLEIKNSPLGPFPSWTADTDCCHPHWYGVRCDPVTHRVVSVQLFYDNQSTGPIPPSIGDLPFLQDLTIRKLPNLSGTIPSAVANLKNLQMARFDSNNLSGPVPSFFHRMTNLYELDLSFNRFSGSIPPQLALAPSLLSLDVSRNLLTGSIPESFGNFKIAGKSPEIWGASVYLILSHNQLSGPIPRSMGNINFTKIDLSRNQLTGDAAFLFGKDKPLQQMDLSRNDLSFDFSTVDMPTGLTSLDLNHNQIFGGFPTTGMENVQFLNVSYNRLCGPIPNVGSLASFDQTAYFHNKCMCGPPLPACKS